MNAMATSAFGNASHWSGSNPYRDIDPVLEPISLTNVEARVVYAHDEAMLKFIEDGNTVTLQPGSAEYGRAAEARQITQRAKRDCYEAAYKDAKAEAQRRVDATYDEEQQLRAELEGQVKGELRETLDKQIRREIESKLVAQMEEESRTRAAQPRRVIWKQLAGKLLKP